MPSLKLILSLNVSKTCVVYSNISLCKWELERFPVQTHLLFSDQMFTHFADIAMFIAKQNSDLVYITFCYENPLISRFLVVEAVAFCKGKYMTSTQRKAYWNTWKTRCSNPLCRFQWIWDQIGFWMETIQQKQIGEKRKAYFVCKFDKLFARLHFRKREKKRHPVKWKWDIFQFYTAWKCLIFWQMRLYS